MATVKEMDDAPTADERLIREAKRRFQYVEQVESSARALFLEDYRFAEGDSNNDFQWPAQVRERLDNERRPRLTINKVRQHNLNIINDAKQNKPAIRIRPAGGDTSVKAAKVFEGIARRIEYQSMASVAYDTATEFQVKGGIGWIRVVTDYAADDSFDQELFIRRVKDPLSVYCDPDAQEFDKSDARWLFVYKDIPREKFEDDYPDHKDLVNQTPLALYDGWVDKDHVRIAEYFRVVKSEDELVYMRDPQSGEQKIVRASDFPREVIAAAKKDRSTKTRKIPKVEVQWYLIVGNEIVDRKTGDDAWPGTTIPLVPVIGEETIIDGKLDRKGHTRAMKDPQRMANYWYSAGVEFAALQSKSPYLTTPRQIEGHEVMWNGLNKDNPPYLLYNDVDDTGQPIAGKPERQQPPVMAPAYVAGMQMAAEEIRAVSGQFQADLGMPSNEQSGRAIQQRQRQGDNATYHYIDNTAIAITRVGKIIIEVAPKIYDTERVLKMMAEDGTEQHVTIDPAAKAALAEEKDQATGDVQLIFNPTIGKYDVVADIGPAFATRRQEAFAALTEVMKTSPEVMRAAGDLIFKAADFPMSDELAERLKRTIPANILGDGPSPADQQLQAQNQQLMSAVAGLTKKLDEAQSDKDVKDDKNMIDAYRAETDRMAALATAMDPAAIAQVTAQLVLQALNTQLPTGSGDAAGGDAAPAPDDGSGAAPDAGTPPMPQQPMPPGGAQPAPQGVM